jgi:hypothetical protein
MSFCCRHVALISSSLDSSKGFLDPRLALDIDPTTLLLTSTSSPLIQSHTVSSGVLFLGGFLLEGINNPLSKLSDTWMLPEHSGIWQLTRCFISPLQQKSS